jgi:hypothetical protein
MGGDSIARSCGKTFRAANNLAVNFRYDHTGLSKKLMRPSGFSFMARRLCCYTNTTK